jgi:hypothetical protein
MSVRLSVRAEHLALAGQGFVKLYIVGFSEICREKIQVFSNSDKNNWNLTKTNVVLLWLLSTFVTALLWLRGFTPR